MSASRRERRTRRAKVFLGLAVRLGAAEQQRVLAPVGRLAVEHLRQVIEVRDEDVLVLVPRLVVHGAVRAEAGELARVQSAPSVFKLSEPNVVEVMSKLAELGLL